MRVRVAVAALLFLVMIPSLGANPEAGEITYREMRAALDKGAKRLVALQDPDGSWKTGKGGEAETADRTALVTLAMTRARVPYIYDSIRNALVFLSDLRPGPGARSAGLVGQAFSKADPKKYREQVEAWARALTESQAAAGPLAGSFAYDVPAEGPGVTVVDAFIAGRGAEACTFFAVLALVDARKAGVEVPEAVWKRAREFYLASQHDDGGWGGPADHKAPSTAAETFEGATALYLIEDLLLPEKEDDTKPVPASAELDKALACVGKHVKAGRFSPFGWFALWQLGASPGCVDFDGVDWYRLGEAELYPKVRDGTIDDPADLAFAMTFLTQELSQVAFAKLKRAGDWETCRGDVQGIARYLGERFSFEKKWRVVTLKADPDPRRLPILYVSGFDPLTLADAEKKKLKAYVDGGGTIVAEAVAGSEKFDKSLRALMKELWPGAALDALGDLHPICQMPRPIRGVRPDVLALALPAEGRLGVFYFPGGGVGPNWALYEKAPAQARQALDLGANLYYYVCRANEKLGRYTPEHKR